MLNKKYIWSFMGQVKGKPTRETMLAKLKNIPGEKFLHVTEEWNDKNQIKISKYKQILKDSVFVPCPSGWGGAVGLKDCFRLYETLEAGSIPIVEKDDYKYFDSFFPGHPLIQVSTDWEEIEDVINELLKDKDQLKAYNEKLIKWWSDYKATLKAKIKEITKPSQKNRLAIVIQTCDHYDFLWEGWKKHFLKNWDFSIPAEIYFCTENKDFSCNNITNIKTGKCESKKNKGPKTFSGRMKNIIQQISQDNILYLQEDMWLHKPIDKKLFINSFDYFINNNLNAFNFGHKLAVNRKFSMDNEVFSIDDFKQYTNTYINDKQVYKRLCEVGHIKTYNPFSITHHSCFFKRDFMLKYLCIEGEKPIDNEINSSKRIAIDYKNTSPLIEGVDYKWYEHVCDNGALNKVGLSLSRCTQKSKTCFINIPRNCSIKQKWKLALAVLNRNENVLLVSSNLLKVSNKQCIKDYIEEDIDIITSQHNYDKWGVKLSTNITSSFIYIKSSIKSIRLIDNLITQLSNINEDERFYSYKEHFSDYILENNINNSELKVKLIPNTEFCVSEEIYGKNIQHYKSNPPAYINFDRNVYTEELKQICINESSYNKR